MKHSKGLLLLTIWLLAMPFAFAQDYKKVTPTAQYKQQGGYMYCTLTHGPINMRLTMQKEGASEHIMPATLQFLIGNIPVGSTEYTSAEDPLNNFYFYEQAGEYYIFQELYDDMMVYYGAYKVSGAKVTSLGDFYCEDYHDYITNEFTKLSAPGTDTAWFVISDPSGKKIELKKSTYVDTDPYVYTNPPLMQKHTAFNWQKSFTPLLKNTITFDLNGDGEFEKFNIDWAKREISYGNTNALLLLNDESGKNYIRFDGETLVLSMSRYWRTDIDTYTYYFSISKKYNTACLDKYSYYTYKSHDENGRTVVNCNFKEDYLPDYWWWIPTLEYFSIKDEEGQDNFHIWNYERRFTISSLTKLLSKKEKANNLENGCALLPDFREIELFFENNPLTAGNVQQYNYLAYYMLEYNHVDDEIDRRPLLSGAQKMLEDITTQFPDRVVAWLNLADAYWEDTAYKDRVATTYSKYLELMKAQEKETKVPQRVYERIK